MRNTLAFLGALVLALVGVGWYLGWYQVFFTPTRGGHETVKIDINTDKVNADLEKGKETILHEGKEALQDLKDKADHPRKKDDNKSTSVLKGPFGVQEESEPPPLPTPFGSATSNQR
jgi:hypothetical protein